MMLGVGGTVCVCEGYLKKPKRHSTAYMHFIRNKQIKYPHSSHWERRHQGSVSNTPPTGEGFLHLIM